jgi:hypothetical protein
MPTSAFSAVATTLVILVEILERKSGELYVAYRRQGELPESKKMKTAQIFI